jgi:spore coat protein U domain-containing protein, fimbrial subunit CupE1/2/3/6
MLAMLVGMSSAAAQCNIGTTSLSFGMYDDRRDSTSNANVTVRCDAGVPFRIVITTGQGSFAQRWMQDDKGNAIVYNLFTRPDYNEVWGDGTAGTTAVAGVGSGAPQILSVFGRIPKGQNPPPGAYFDNITLTIQF